MNDAETVRRRVIGPLERLEKLAEKAGNGMVALVARRAVIAIEELLKDLEQSEANMGRAADAINKLQGELSTANSSLTTAQANALDAADITAIDGVLGTATSNASTGTTANASGGSTTGN